MALWLREVTDPGDVDVERFAHRLKTVFADENICLGADRMREFLAASPGPERSFHLVVAREGEEVVGGSLFSSIVATGAGFSEYMVLAPPVRGRGVSRQLFDYRRAVLDREARCRGFPEATGLFIEVENPGRTPTEYAERERLTAMDLWDRWRYFQHLGFFRLAFPYVQPPLALAKEPVTYLDLLFLPWASDLREARAIAPAFVAESVAPVWRGWAPGRAGAAVQELRTALGGQPIPMMPLEVDPSNRSGGVSR